MAWWGWDRWERELDWMALHGVNLALAHVGQEELWRRAFSGARARAEGFALAREDVARWQPGAAYLAWHRMGNLHSLEGPLDARWAASQVPLQRRILARMRALGIAPVLPAFNGYVPTALVDKYRGTPQQAHFRRGGKWMGFGLAASGVYLLDPASELFAKIGRAFVDAQLEAYQDLLAPLSSAASSSNDGENSPPPLYFSCDTWNEVDPSPEEDVGAGARAAHGAMAAGAAAVGRRAVWVMQTPVGFLQSSCSD